MTEPIQTESPKVFISYSHNVDIPSYKGRILDLANRLRGDGIQTKIDQYILVPPEGWPRWVLNQLDWADFVLVACSEEYDRRFRGNEAYGQGRGSTWEGGVIIQELYDAQNNNSKFIPIAINSRDSIFVPSPLRSTNCYQVDTDNGYGSLYYHLRNQPEASEPPLGKLKELPLSHHNASIPHEAPVTKPVESSINYASGQPKEFCNLPRKSYGDFIGRRDEITEILERISPLYRQHITVISGIGGVGKTALAVEVASRCWDAKKSGNNHNGSIPIFDAIIFTSSKSTEFINNQIIDRPEKESQLTDIFRLIADVLDEPTVTQVMAEEQHQKVKDVLSKRSTLLIVDNMETLSDDEQNKILAFLNNVPETTQVLITTRDSRYPNFANVLIQNLTRAESSAFLNAQIKSKGIKPSRVIANYKKWRGQVYDRFKGIPIALIYVVGQLADGHRPYDITNPTITPSTEELGRFCFESSIDSIRNTPAYQLLMAMAFFDKLSCRQALIRVAGLQDGKDAADGIVKLKRLSLITEQQGEFDYKYDILPITLEFVIHELDANDKFKLSARDCWYEWYLEFVKQYGGLDWEGWRATYDHLDSEWGNIESVLNWCVEKAEWQKLLNIWQNVDNYADLNRYWQDRRYWWALLSKKYGSTEVRVKARSEKGFTLILMGTQHYKDAESYLKEAYALCGNEVDQFVCATVANHRAVLAKVKKDFEAAHSYLDDERSLLKDCLPGKEREQKRYQIRNLYYRGEVLYLDGKLSLAKDAFNQARKLSKEAGWQRFRNYTKNMLAEIFIKEGDLREAEELLKAGFDTASQARESRRIALYQASYGRFFYKKYQQEKEHNSPNELLLHYIFEARDYANKALDVFSKEFMLVEKEDLEELMKNLEIAEIERKELHLMSEQ
jgi:hypothetical protein